MTYTSWSVVFGEQPSATKWNLLGSNDAHFYDFLGDNLAWQTFAPGFANLSGGTLTYAKYSITGTTVQFRMRYVLAGAGVAGSVTFSLPVTASSDYAANDAIDSSSAYRDATDSTIRTGAVSLSSTTVGILGAHKADGTYTTLNVLSSTVPFTWASGDIITVAGTYEKA